MDKTKMSEKLCALSNSEIIKRRKPLAKPILTAIGGAAVLAINALWVNPEWDSMQIGLGLLGWSLLLIGGVIASRRAFDSEGVPYDTLTGDYVRYEELYFPREIQRRLLEWSQKGEVEQFRRVGQSAVSALVVACYTTSDGRLTGYQLFEYVELEYRPLDEFRLQR